MFWQDVFKTVILLLIAAAGAPITTVIKNILSSIFKKPIEDKAALTVTGLVAAAVAILEMYLSGVLDFATINVGNFPNAFFAVFSVATIYYHLLKGTSGVLGRGLLLKESVESPLGRG